MLLVILAGAMIFTNAVEWFGHRLGVGEGVTGSIFAAVGTTLPETVIPLVAVFTGGESGDEVAVGSILGAPLILATLAMFVVAASVIGLSLRGRREAYFNVNQSIVSRDLFFFVIVYALAIGAALIDSRSIKIGIAVVLALCYVLYVWLHVRADDDSHAETPDLGSLWFQRSAERPGLTFIALQLVVALALIVGRRSRIRTLGRVGFARTGSIDDNPGAFYRPAGLRASGEVQLGDMGLSKKGHAGVRQYFGGHGLAKLRGADYRHCPHRLGVDGRKRASVYQRGRVAGGGGHDRACDENARTSLGFVGPGGWRRGLFRIPRLHTHSFFVTAPVYPKIPPEQAL